MLHDAKRKVEDELTKKFEKQLEANTREVTQEVTKEVTEKTTLDMARRMKKEKASLDFISKVTGISIQEVEKM